MVGGTNKAQAPILIVLFRVEMAPAVVSARPFSVAPVWKLIAPAATIIPWKRDLTPKLTAPLT